MTRSAELQDKLAYYIDFSIHEIPSIAYIARETGGTIFTDAEATFRCIRDDHPDLQVVFHRSIDDIRKAVVQFGVKVILYPDYHIRFFKDLPGVRHVQVFHGTSDKRYDYSRMVRDYDLFFIAGREAFERYRKMGHLKGGKGILIGYPKLDRVFRGELERDSELQKLGMNPANRTVLYAPTWVDRERNSSWKGFREQIAMKKPDHLNLIVKLHPNITRYRADEVRRFSRMLQSRRNTLLLDNLPDIIPVLAAADLLLGDVSSVTREYLAFQKPYVFLSNKPKWLWSRRKIRLWECGRVVRNPEKIWRVVGEVLNSPHEYEDSIVRHFQRTFYKPDGGAAVRAKEAVYDLLNEGNA
jgi:CDP-glycerol glycerophosphotransferase (TagB/SpsB family)